MYWEGKRVATELRYSDSLLMFLLRAHRPEKFGDKFKVHAPTVDAAIDHFLRERDLVKPASGATLGTPAPVYEYSSTGESRSEAAGCFPTIRTTTGAAGGSAAARGEARQLPPTSAAGCSTRSRRRRRSACAGRNNGWRTSSSSPGSVRRRKETSRSSTSQRRMGEVVNQPAPASDADGMRDWNPEQE